MKNGLLQKKKWEDGCYNLLRKITHFKQNSQSGLILGPSQSSLKQKNSKCFKSCSVFN